MSDENDEWVADAMTVRHWDCPASSAFIVDVIIGRSSPTTKLHFAAVL